ncbi:methyl-accepting chemotaxis protein [Pseudomonas zeshuii]|nr:methyl-accepting chemotaxis protein [Pseudomonas zeshuii]MBA1246604.1 methyl-accepting chemotaxis protein [Pseudomonas zeshuii]
MLSRIKFSHKILATASVVLIAAFSLFMTYNDYLQRTAITRDLTVRLNELGTSASSNIANWVSGRITLLEGEAQAVQRDLAPQAFTAVLEQKAYTSSFDLTYLGQADGTFTVRPSISMPAGYDPRTRPWYQGAQTKAGSILTEPYVDAASGGLIMSLATPVMHEGQLAGVLGGDLSLQTMVGIVNSLDLGGIGHAILVNSEGKVLVSPRKEEVMKNLAELFPAGAPALDGALKRVELDGKPQLMVFKPVTGLPSVNWYLGLMVDEEKAYAPLKEFRTSAVLAMVIGVVLIMLLLGVLIRVLMRPLTTMSQAMQDIAQGEGDLTRRLAINSQDEFGVLAAAFNRFVERIHGSISEVSASTRQLNEVSRQVLAASNSSLHNSDNQAGRTGSVAAAINQLGAATQEIARNAADASVQATSARQQAEEGRRVLGQTLTAMETLSANISASCGRIDELNQKTTRIGHILEVIQGISEQTNLLALNAAIEAARAGDAGRGFAVVADEVRGLAHRTQSSAREIQSMIQELQTGAGEAVSTMTESQRFSEDSMTIAQKANERLGSVAERITDIDGMTQSVAAATEEQSAVVESLNVDITEINSLNQQGVENLNATLGACHALEQQANRLDQLVSSFRI